MICKQCNATYERTLSGASHMLRHMFCSHTCEIANRCERSRDIVKELDTLAQKRDEDIDTSDIPEVLDWSKAVVGKFYRPKGCPIKPQIELWEILVPTIDRQKTEYIKGFHKKWDAKVRAITGGLTIRPVKKGQWVHPESKNLSAERMIPVKIAATQEQMLYICKMTAEYYDQEVIMAYRISDRVIMMKRNGMLEGL